MPELIRPHGGTLIDLMLPQEQRTPIVKASHQWPSWTLSKRQLCDLELLLNGGFSPLTGFMNKADYDAVVNNMRLADGTLWPMPIVLDVDEKLAKSLSSGDKLVLRDTEGAIVALLTVGDIWQPDLQTEAEKVYGTSSAEHAGVKMLFDQTNSWYVGGRVEGIEHPSHFDFSELRLTPKQLREHLQAENHDRVVAFQTRNPMHRAHQELTKRAADEVNASILLHPVVGTTKPGDIDHFTRVRCYQTLLKYYTDHQVTLSLLPLSMRMAGPREALWHAIIRKNYGASHFIVGRDHAAPGPASDGTPFYDPYDAHELLKSHTDELDIKPLFFEELVYLNTDDRFIPRNELEAHHQPLKLSGTQLRNHLAQGTEIPSWFSFPEVVSELRRRHPSKSERGFTLFFTGLSCAGKSTIARAIYAKLQETDPRSVSLLDGDIVRRLLSSKLGFSREDRKINILRIAYVASEITKAGGIAICAPIAPYEADRLEAAEIVRENGDFILVHVATPLEVCEQRDRKGLYSKARAGLIKGFTGISDPYEVPTQADITINTFEQTIQQASDRVYQYLINEGYVNGQTIKAQTAAIA